MATQKSSYSSEDLIACGKGELFGPRNAQLPLPPMLMFDRISSISMDGGEYGKGYVEAEFDVNPTAKFKELIDMELYNKAYWTGLEILRQFQKDM